MLKSVTCNPPAKINLTLKILGKRKNGFHDIETILQTIGLSDSLKITRTEDQSIKLTILGSELPANESNLCFKAAELFSKEVEKFQGCSIILTKNIPHGAGLGGGSSDAAYTLTCLNQLYENSLTNENLFELASLLGSDVPFFLRGGTAIGMGRGEILSFTKTSWEYPVLVIFPNLRISTSWAYRNVKIALTSKPNYNILLSLSSESISPADFKTLFSNDFESLVFSKYPNLGELKERLYQQGAFYAGLSGSGSSLFGLFFSNEQAEKAKSSFQDSLSVFLTKFV